MIKILFCLTLSFFSIIPSALAAPEPIYESIGDYEGTTDEGESLYLRKIYPDKLHNGYTGFRYYVVGNGKIHRSVGVTRYCDNLKPVWTISKDTGDVTVKATSRASRTMLNDIGGFNNDR